MYTLGLDIGSTTSKCVIMNGDKQIIASQIIVSGIGTDGPTFALEGALSKAKLMIDQIDKTAVTGYGRTKYEEADFKVSELTCHALGGRFIFPTVRTIIDIGGQDAKVISLDQKGNMVNFVMNDKCAAGTGRFLDVMANIMKIDISELASCAKSATHSANISSTCTVFAESEVISQLANGEKIPNVVSGICESVANRVANLVKRQGVITDVCMSGGVAQNNRVREAMSNALSVPILYDDSAQIFGAIGAALYALDRV